MKKCSDAKRQQICALLDQGLSRRVIAGIANVAPSTVQVIKKETGRALTDRDLELTEAESLQIDRKAKVWRLIKEGQTIRQIAKETGIPSGTVSRYKAMMPNWWRTYRKRKT